MGWLRKKEVKIQSSVTLVERWHVLHVDKLHMKGVHAARQYRMKISKNGRKNKVPFNAQNAP